ncbi:MAG: thioesterase [Candidatus Melainabacteria bacterium HGW-Melainabacteria-1]|nr:MAG: thioesterase [Candidatus Melainabacteria bacterium HGW-Melainabacteria-1]
MSDRSFQESYPEDYSHCYGCGTNNNHGLHVTSRWDGEVSVCEFQPREYHLSFPGFVYGGLIASVVDCHSTGTAAAAAYRAEGREFGSEPPLRFVTASLKVDYLKPTPIDSPMVLRSHVKEINGRKVIVETDVLVNNILCARGEVVAVKIPDSMAGK